ncbi:MAG TPA: ferredoxin, partial [Thermopetrobacter sp.]|nr:ferredoxin [Thermopetrobacter sp.]
KAEMAGRLAGALLGLADGGEAPAVAASLVSAAAGDASPSAPAAASSSAAVPDDYEPVWIDTPDCTTCDECVELAPGIFQYNEDDQAIVVNPQGGTFEDIVKAAEKCTAMCIHPGTPWNMNEKNIDKLIKRAEKFQ